MRLPIILVQNPPASGAELADALVGNLIGRAGLDLTLVNQFESLSPDSTDRMTLEGITVPAAVLDWRTTAELKSTLDKIGFHGRRCPHQLDPTEDDGSENSTSGSQRRLFLFNLNETTDPLAIVAELNRLRESLSVKTVSLGGLASPQPRTKSDRPQDKETEVIEPTTNRESTATNRAVGRMETTSDEGLDALLDQLDELDV